MAQMVRSDKHGIWKKILVRVFGAAWLDNRQPLGFSAPVPFYLAKCKSHGYYEDYYHGFENSRYLSCPACRRG